MYIKKLLSWWGNIDYSILTKIIKIVKLLLEKKIPNKKIV